MTNVHEEIEKDRITDLSMVFREDIEQDVDLVIRDKLVKAGITEQELDALRDAASKYMKPVHDKEGLKELQGVLTPLVTMRNRIKLICKKGREKSNMVSKAWIANEKEYVAMVASIEDPLTKYKDEYKAEQERIKAEEEAEAKRQVDLRYAALEELGMVRRVATIDAPERYEIGDLSINTERVATADAEVWGNILRSATIVVEEKRAEAERVEAEQKRIEAERKAEAEKIEAEAKEQARRAKEIAEKEAALNAKIEKARENEVKAIGANGMEAPLRPYAQHDDDAWEQMTARLAVTVETRRKKEAEAAVKREQEQKQREEAIRAKAVEDERRRRAEEAERERMEAKQRQERMDDREKWTAYIDGLRSVEVPAMASAEAKKAVDGIAGAIEKASADFPKALEA